MISLSASARTCLRSLIVSLAAAGLFAGTAHAQIKDRIRDRTYECPEPPPPEPPYSEAQLEQLVAPVALYPDSLLSLIFMASTYPLEVRAAARWVEENPDVEGRALRDAMDEQPWDPSVQSLAAFPDVLEMMDEHCAWTLQLGEAVLADQDDVLDAVQALRARAEEQGTLKTTKRQKVKKKTVAAAGGGTETIYVIESARPDVVYVPTYNPRVVYGDWAYSDYPPYSWYPADRAAAGVLTFAAGVAVGAALWAGFDWDRGYVDVDVDRYNRYYDTKISAPRWRHDVEHRRGVGYRSPEVRRRFEEEVREREPGLREPEAERPGLRRGERPEGEEAPALKPEEAPAEEPKVEEKPAEEPKPEEAPAEEPKPEEVPAEEPKPEEVPAEEPKAEEAPAEEPKPEEAPAEEPKPEEAPAEEPKPEEAPAEEPKPEEAPAEEPKPEDAPAEEPKPEEAPAEEPKPEEAPAEAPKVEEAPAPAEEPKAKKAPAPAEEPKVEEAPAQAPKAEEVPAEEPKAKEAPAEPPEAAEPPRKRPKGEQDEEAPGDEQAPGEGR